ncbi:UvrD-helicase domain-containing protein, partial [Acinetobacter seifertii]|uniref:UvrD-helicase domain-containing protein n=1 Tax=Acinetobacter seifertii TaxID=1530123 RepID=UPI001580171A
MNSRVQVSYQPITDIEFSGLHLIEASAGTGKTYTLSSLMVRIFLEKYLPRQVIATTFTRAAAAELKSRIRARLVETYRYLDAKRSLTEKEILLQAEHESDLLLQHVLKHFATRIGYACERLKLVIDQLDELFVGTLDSFSQKLLREFAFESGKIERAQITDDAKTYSRQLIHDVLREWIQSQPQTVIDFLYMSGELKSTESYIKLVEESLSFSSAYFKPVDLPVFSTAEFEIALNKLAQAPSIYWDGLKDYYLLDGQYYKFINKKAFAKDRFHLIFETGLSRIIRQIKKDGVKIFFHREALKDIEVLFLDSKGQIRNTVFNKCDQAIQDNFYQHPIIQI